MKYTQRQWDRVVGWGKVPEGYSSGTPLKEYKSKINYDVWADVSNIKYNVKVNYNVQSQTGNIADSGNRDNKS
tara:strand:- start:1333 stop:1551 length:219 start_codon:yes stop_codon:yes gene_type:complete